MAEFGAHITGATDADTPSIFEVLAQESLISSLRPALRYAFKVIAQNYPAKFGWLYSLGDEVYTVLDLILENYYLSHYGSSFAENFYGMKRVVVEKEHEKGSASLKLPTSNHIKSLLFLVLAPYIKNKCDEMYDSLLDRNDRGITYSTEWKQKLVKAFLAAYPYIHSTWQGAQFFYQLAFIFGKSKYHSPFLKWAGVVLKNLDMSDIEKQQQKWNSFSLDFSNKTILQNLWMIASRGFSLCAMILSSSLSMSVFFLQFLEWWYSSDQRVTSITSLPIPEPPTVEKVENFPVLSSMCPLCNKFRTNDTVLAVTGYVFCYPCIYKYVQQWQQCPVTGFPATTQHLVKLYLPDG